jgi:hypothetical protein
MFRFPESQSLKNAGWWTRECLLETKGEPFSMSRRESCCRPDCPRPSLTSLGAERFCSEHFFERCYELLERIDDWQRCAGASPTPEQAYFVNECAQRVLEISLRSTELSNLERARLLDILLWSGDLAASLRKKRSAANPACIAGEAVERAPLQQVKR